MSTSLTFYKLVGDISAGSSFVVNKGASGNTASAIVVFNTFSDYVIVSGVYPKIGSVKVGGQNLFTEEIKILYEIGEYSEAGGFQSWYEDVSDTVSESDGTTTSSGSKTGLNRIISGAVYLAYRITVSSTKSARGAEVVMSNFQLQADYVNYYHTITTNVSPSGAGAVSGGGKQVINSTITLTATPNTGYKFVKWNDGVTTASRTITVTGNATYTAYFEKLPPPEFTSAEMIYGGKQISQANKVIAGQSFIISVAVT